METTTTVAVAAKPDAPAFLNNPAPTSGAQVVVKPDGRVIDAAFWNEFRAEVDRRKADPRKAWSLSTLHKRTGLSTSALSKWLAGKPEGNVPKQEEVLRKFLARERAAELLPAMPTDLVPLKLADLVQKSIETIWFGGWFGLISVPKGCGSTTACARLAKYRETPILVRAQTAETSLWSMVGLLYSRLTNRTSERRRFTARLEYVRDNLKGAEGESEKSRLVIVDQAHLLDASALRFFRDLHERNHVPVALVAHAELADRLHELEDVAYHIAPHLPIVPPHASGEWFSEAEVRNYVGRFVPGCNAEVLKRARAIANRDGHLVTLGFWLRLFQFYKAAGKDALKAMRIADGQLLTAKG